MGNNKQGLVKLLKTLSDLSEDREIVKYEITENFVKHKEHTYNIINLSGEVFNNEVIFMDDEGVLLDNDVFVLNGFLIKSIIDIDVGIDYFKMTFRDGYIIIKVV